MRKKHWAQDPQLETESFTSRTSYDALNRQIQSIAPHSDRAGTRFNILQPVYNEANLLERLDTWLGLEQLPTMLLNPEMATQHIVKNIDYNAKGQRKLIEYGNDVETSYVYDNLTFRLISLLTLRGNEHIQDLQYTYDPIGNITHIKDDSDLHNTIFFRNARVEPSSDYTYDALYRLVQATGREHLGNIDTGALLPPASTSHTDEPCVNLPHPNDGKAMGSYTESYKYDSAGNITEIDRVRTADPSLPGWNRTYDYNTTSQIQPGGTSNHLTSTKTGEVMELFTHDGHGNMTSMPHLHLMQWDYRDQLAATSKLIVTNGGTPEITYYVYGASGQRVHKVNERFAPGGQTPTRKDERIYLSPCEIYREYDGDGTKIGLERETFHIVANDSRVALIEARVVGNDPSPAQLVRYQFDNHLGSSTLEIDENAGIISYEEYFPYGSTSYQAVRSTAERPKRYRYVGKEREEESGLCYHGARYYITWIGRWSSADPIGLDDGVNLFIYCQDRPLVMHDLTGRRGDAPRPLHETLAETNVVDDEYPFFECFSLGSLWALLFCQQ